MSIKALKQKKNKPHEPIAMLSNLYYLNRNSTK